MPDRRLNGLNPLSYVGVNPYMPPDLITNKSSDPTANDAQNVELGTFWLNRNSQALWYLASLSNNVATWIKLSSGSGNAETLTGNTGGPVPPTGSNINVVGDGTTITVAGNPGTSTLTLSAVGTGLAQTLTGNSGGAVGPSAGNINLVGSTLISVVGNPATHTLTITPSGSIADLFTEDSGTATPSSGNLNIRGGNNISTSGAGSTVTINVSGTTQHAVQIGNSTASLTSLAVGTNGQVLIGATTANPAFATLTSSDSSIAFTPGANTLSLQVANLTPTTLTAFLATQSGTITNVTGDGTVYVNIYDSVAYNQGSAYNNSTGQFTAPVTGLYHFNATVIPQNLSSGHTGAYIALQVNGAGGFFGQIINPYVVQATAGINIGQLGLSIGMDMNLTSGNTVEAVLYVDNSTKTVTSGANSFFSGHLIR